MFPDSAVNDEGDLVHMALFAEMEPVSFEEASQKKQWMMAMKEELHSIEKNGTWELTELPKGKKAISVKWVYKLKLKPDGEIAKFKARLVAKGFLQRPGLDYDEVFAPVARIETVRLVIALASYHQWRMQQMDVKSAFLNGPLTEEVYVMQPRGFKVKGQEEKVYRLHKALYGLKQAPRAWNKRIDAFLIQKGFTKCTIEYGIYTRGKTIDEMLIICLYVEDLLITGSSNEEINMFKEMMKSEFEMSDLGDLTYFLGMEFVKTEKGIFMHQRKYILDVLKRFDMLDCNLTSIAVETGPI